MTDKVQLFDLFPHFPVRHADFFTFSTKYKDWIVIYSDSSNPLPANPHRIATAIYFINDTTLSARNLTSKHLAETINKALLRDLFDE